MSSRPVEAAISRRRGGTSFSLAAAVLSRAARSAGPECCACAVARISASWPASAVASDSVMHPAQASPASSPRPRPTAAVAYTLNSCSQLSPDKQARTVSAGRSWGLSSWLDSSSVTRPSALSAA